MPERIVIDPVTRIEGHAKISIYLDDDGTVTDARFHVTEFRGFEKMYEGRPMWEMPAITARVCGICPVSHLTASAKAGDQILAVRVPPAAVKLRRFANWAQILQSHALSFFHLSSPDLLLGMDSDPSNRNIFGLIAANPDLARAGIRLRQFGQRIIAALGGQKIHPAWVVPGGVRHALPDEDKAWVRARLPEVRQTTLDAIGLFKGLLETFREEAEVFGKFPTMHLGLVAPDGTWETYDGNMRFCDSEGKTVEEVEPARYKEFIAEKAESWSYIKTTFFKPLGHPDGIYRVGPLARLNVCDKMGTPLADMEFAEFRGMGREATNASFLFHYARLIEILASIERIEGGLDDPDLQSEHIRSQAGVNNHEGIGCCEAPRGILFHHYQVTDDGLIRKANLLIATAQNNLAMNRTVTQIAKHYVKGREIPEGILNRLEAGIRTFDPCLSCSTHAAGQMPLAIELIGSDGDIIAERRRGNMHADALVIGYGNTLRGDDGIGPAVAEDVAALALAGVRAIVTHQLTPELAADLADARLAVFVDATIGGEPVRAVRIEAAAAGAVMTHAADPRGLLALCMAVYRRCPVAWIVTATGADFDFGDNLSPIGQENAREALVHVQALIRESSDA